jgi:hypothetical protein
MNRLFKAPTLVLVFALGMMANAQPLKVQILNGKSGKPVANEHVNLFRNGDFADPSGNRNIPGFNTDANGIFTVSQIAPETDSFTVAVDWHRPCAKDYAKFSLHEIFSKGIVSENACKPKLERTAIPGTLILFVRDETFFEKMAH